MPYVGNKINKKLQWTIHKPKASGLKGRIKITHAIIMYFICEQANPDLTIVINFILKVLKVVETIFILIFI